jgi:hypothetical protein
METKQIVLGTGRAPSRQRPVCSSGLDMVDAAGIEPAISTTSGPEAAPKMGLGRYKNLGSHLPSPPAAWSSSKNLWRRAGSVLLATASLMEA